MLGRRLARTAAGVLTFGVVLAVGVALAACSSDGRQADDGDRLTVVASFFPLADAAEHAGGPDVRVVNLTPPGVEPHDLELNPDDVEAIQAADVVVLVGGGFQPAIDEALDGAQGLVVDVLEGIDAAPESGEEADEGLSLDPHVWLDPSLFAVAVDQIAAALGQADPDRADTYTTNGDAYGDELAALDAEFEQTLSGCERDLLVTSHAAFGYLAEAYGLRQEAIAGIEPESEPDPNRLAELGDLVEREGVTTIFTEELVSPAVAETLAEETGVDTAVLDTLEGAPDGGGDYGSAMRANLETLRDALGC